MIRKCPLCGHMHEPDVRCDFTGVDSLLWGKYNIPVPLVEPAIMVHIDDPVVKKKGRPFKVRK